MLPFGRNARREGNQFEIEQRHADLDAGRHAHFVRVDEIVIGEEESTVQP